MLTCRPFCFCYLQVRHAGGWRGTGRHHEELLPDQPQCCVQSSVQVPLNQIIWHRFPFTLSADRWGGGLNLVNIPAVLGKVFFFFSPANQDFYFKFFNVENRKCLVISYLSTPGFSSENNVLISPPSSLTCPSLDSSTNLSARKTPLCNKMDDSVEMEPLPFWEGVYVPNLKPVYINVQLIFFNLSLYYLSCKIALFNT